MEPASLRVSGIINSSCVLCVASGALGRLLRRPSWRENQEGAVARSLLSGGRCVATELGEMLGDCPDPARSF